MFMTSNQKQAACYKQEQYWHGKVKSLDATELRNTFNSILSNYDTCIEKMKLVVSSIVLSLNEITQTDGQKSGIFRHTDRNKIDGDYAIKQIVGII